MNPAVCDTNADLCVTGETTEIAGKAGFTAIWSVCDTGEGGRVKRCPSCVCDVRAQQQATRALARSDAQARARAGGAGR